MNFDSAIYFLTKSINSPVIKTKAGAVYHLYQIAKQNKNWEEYAILQEQYEELRDSIQEQTYTETLQHMQSLYNYQQVEKEAERHKLNHAISQRNNYRSALIIVLLVSALIGYMIYIQNRKRDWLAKEKRLNDLNEEIMRNSESQISLNKFRIQELEQSLTEIKENGRILIESEKKRLEFENMQIQQSELSKKLREEALYTSDVYKRFHNCTSKKASNEDTANLINAIDTTYPDFSKRLILLLPGIDYTTKLILYMVKTNLKPRTIAIYIGRSDQFVSTKRRRLCNEILGNEKSLEEFDGYIRSL